MLVSLGVASRSNVQSKIIEVIPLDSGRSDRFTGDRPLIYLP